VLFHARPSPSNPVPPSDSRAAAAGPLPHKLTRPSCTHTTASPMWLGAPHRGAVRGAKLQASSDAATSAQHMTHKNPGPSPANQARRKLAGLSAEELVTKAAATIPARRSQRRSAAVRAPSGPRGAKAVSTKARLSAPGTQHA
jgi:hypothetical protein